VALYAFDGTWNDSSAPDDQRDARKDTNVHRFRALYNGSCEYKDGVGTRYGFVGKIVGGLTGAGAQSRIEEQFKALKTRFTAGDTDIDIVGYSRGAAIARMFVQRIGHDFYELERGGKPLESPPKIRFLGLFDTVASFGIPWSQNEGDFKPEIPEFVEHTFHAMALDETRETFGIERCLGNRNTITEVWFRGGHGDVGGNATYVERKGSEVSNRERSDVALNWMLAKANACGVPVPAKVSDAPVAKLESDAPVTALKEPISIGNAGTLSRRIHIGDLVHHSVERIELTRGIDGRLLRRIGTLTRIEDATLEARADAFNWIPPLETQRGPDNVATSDATPSLVQLSLRRYPFDVLPARTWNAWMEIWKISDRAVASGREDEFWAPTAADRALAWDIYVELRTRVAVQELGDDEGDDATALKSIYELFPLSRECMRKHGVGCAHTGALLTAFLNQKVRPFTAAWHKKSVNEEWGKNPGVARPDFREALRRVQPVLRELATALSNLGDARL
jgi:hypothetical protein